MHDRFVATRVDHSPRRAGDELIVDQARSQVQTFFDELKNGTPNYRTVASLVGQVAQEYREGAFSSYFRTPTMHSGTRPFGTRGASPSC